MRVSFGDDYMKKIFFCNSYYHILISIIKIIADNKKNINYIVLTDDNCIIDFSSIAKKIKNNKIVEDVYCIKYPKYLTKCNQSFLGLVKKNIFCIFFKPRFLNLNDYDEIYIYNDTSIVGRYINRINKKYILLEDGTDCYKKNHNYIIENNKAKHFFKKIFGINELGSSNNIEYIEVNDKANLEISNKKIVENSKKDMFEKLSDSDIKILQNIFLDDINISVLNNKCLIITQPLSEDGFLETENDKIEQYKKILLKLGLKECDVVFKIHPRESTNYSFYFKNSYVMKENFPIEILNFFPSLKFKYIITISSTAIDLLDNCDKKIILGWEWLNEK